jgi:hypothetical protein
MVRVSGFDPESPREVRFIEKGVAFLKIGPEVLPQRGRDRASTSPVILIGMECGDFVTALTCRGAAARVDPHARNTVARSPAPPAVKAVTKSPHSKLLASSVIFSQALSEVARCTPWRTLCAS